MKKILEFIDKILAKIVIFFIILYQYTLSPDKGIPSLWLKGKICAHEPHCSQYGILTLKRYGFFNGIYKVIDRIFRCKPSYCKQYDPEFYRVVFFCSAPIGVPFLEKLYKDNRFEVVGVVTTPDKPIGRGMKIQKNIIKKTAEKYIKNHDEINTPNKIRKKSEEGLNFQKRLSFKKPDFIVVIAYGKIIPQSILDIPIIAPINIHGSLLPEYRGASPIQSVFLDVKQNTGITIIKMDSGLDTGNIINKQKFKIDFYRTTLDVIEKMKEIGPKFLVDTLWKYGKKMLGEVKQDEEKVSLCNKIEKDSGRIYPEKDYLENIYKKYRGYYLWPKIYFFLDSSLKTHGGKRIVIEELILDEQLYQKERKNKLFIGKKINPAIKKIGLKPEGKKKLTREQFVSGYLNYL